MNDSSGVDELKAKKATLQRQRQKMADEGVSTQLIDKLISNTDKAKNKLCEPSSSEPSSPSPPDSPAG